MSWMDNQYQATNIKAKTVSCEGDYVLRIDGVTDGVTDAKDKSGSPVFDEDGEKKQLHFTRVTCSVKAEGFPQLSIFLTEGPNLSGELTAFFDTFLISRGDFNYQHWIKHYGRMHILLKQKDGFVNMVPRYLLGDDGYVDKKKACVAASEPHAAVQTQQIQQTQPIPVASVPDRLTDENGEELIF